MTFVKITQGSFNQGNGRFGESAGKQCTCCSLFSIIFSTIKSPGYWTRPDLDYILSNGTEIYRNTNKHNNDYVLFIELPREIIIFEDCKFSIEFLDIQVGLLHHNSVYGSIGFNHNLDSRIDGFLFILNGVCISVTWNKTSFFLFDSHSRNEHGISSSEGTSTVMKFNSKKALETFIIRNYLTENATKIFSLNYNISQLIKKIRH